MDVPNLVLDLAQIRDDAAQILAILADRTADLIGHAIERFGELRDLDTQISRDRTHVADGGVDVRTIRGHQRAHFLRDLPDIFDNVFETLLAGHRPVPPVTLLPRFWSQQADLRIQACGVIDPRADVALTRLRPAFFAW